MEVHFATLIEVLMTAIDFGMDSAPEIYVERVRSLRRERKVRNLLVEATKHGMTRSSMN